MDEVRAALRLGHYSRLTERAYVGWIRRYILFHQKRHPRDMGVAEIRAFLSSLAVDRKVAASTQNQALNALLFLMYGSGLRLMECVRLRVKDIDIAAGRIVVRDGKGGQDIRTIQKLLGHKDVSTTMIYTHVAGLNATGTRSPLDTSA